ELDTRFDKQLPRLARENREEFFLPCRSPTQVAIHNLRETRSLLSENVFTANVQPKENKVVRRTGRQYRGIQCPCGVAHKTELALDFLKLIIGDNRLGGAGAVGALEAAAAENQNIKGWCRDGHGCAPEG